MVLLKYLCPLHDLPAPAAVQEETVVPVAESKKKQRGKYQHFAPEEEVTIGRYASKHRVTNTVKHFKESVKRKYHARWLAHSFHDYFKYKCIHEIQCPRKLTPTKISNYSQFEITRNFNPMKITTHTVHASWLAATHLVIEWSTTYIQIFEACNFCCFHSKCVIREIFIEISLVKIKFALIGEQLWCRIEVVRPLRWW